MMRGVRSSSLASYSCTEYLMIVEERGASASPGVCSSTKLEHVFLGIAITQSPLPSLAP